jgi:hypothetical protein
MKAKWRKTIPLPAKGGDDGIEGKLPLAKCKELLSTSAAKYTDEQILEMRDWFYKLAAITHDEYIEKAGQTTKIIPINEQSNGTGNEERNYLRAG